MKLPAWFRRALHRAPDPSDAFRAELVRANDAVAQPAPWRRIIPAPCRRPNGAYVMGWCAFAHNDAERAEVLCAWLIHRKEQSA